MRTKRSVAWLLSIAMIISMLPNLVVYAAGGLIDPSQKAQIEFVQMKYKDSVIDEFTNDPNEEEYASEDDIADTSYKDENGLHFRAQALVEETTRPEISEIDLNKEYLVGIKISGLDNVTETQYGLINMTIPILYDANYIELTDTPSSLSEKFEFRLGRRVSTNLYSGYYKTGSSGSDCYDVNNNSVAVSTGMLSIPMISTNNTQPPYTDGADFYFAVLKYKFKELPPETGHKIFTLDINSEELSTTYASYFTAGLVDSSGSSVNYQPTAGDADIRELFEVSTTAVNFPVSYTVEFYNSYDADTTAYGDKIADKDIVIAEGASVSETDGAALPVSTDFTAPSGKYYSKLQYIDQNGDAQDFTEDTVISSSMFADGDTTLKVFATYVDGHTVTFNSNYQNGTTEITKDITVAPTAGTTIATDKEPTVGTTGTEDFAEPTGYIFKEWNTQSDGLGDKIIFGDGGTDVSAIDNVYAIWTQAYEVKFVTDKNDVANSTVQVTYVDPDADDKTVSKPDTDPTKTGYTFKGWYYDNNGTETAFVEKGATDGTPTEITQSTVIYAKWAKSVTVKYYPSKDDATNDTNKLGEETVIAADNLADVPTVNDDTVNHTFFNGWKNSADDATFDTTAVIPADTTLDSIVLYADMKDAYTVTFYNEKEKTTTYATVYANSVTTGSLGTDMPNDPTSADETKAFAGWYTVDGDTEFKSDTEVTANVEVYPKWTDLIKITFNNNDGTSTTTDVYVTPNVQFDKTAPADPTRANYDFAGWDTKSNGTGTRYADKAAIEAATFAAATVLYAQWTPSDGQDTATLTFDTVGGNAANPASITVVKGDQILASQMPDTPTKTSSGGYDYIFTGWYEAATLTNTTAITAPITMNEDKTAYAHWNYTAEDAITITFDDDDATTAVSPTTVNIGTGDSIGDAMPTDPEKTGYTFGGWYENVADESTKRDKNSTFTANTTLTAKWIEDITVNYDDNGGTGGPVSATEAASDVYTDPTEPTRTNYVFAGWNTKSNGTGVAVKADGTKKYSDIAALDGNTGSSITVYAQWTPAPGQDTATLTFDTVGGDAANPASITVVKGDSITAAQMPNIPTKTSASGQNYVFKGWFEAATLTNTDEMIAPITMNEDKTAYAHWDYTEADAITITFNDNGATTAVSPTTVNIGPGDSIGDAMPTDPAKTGNAFKGWFVDVEDDSTEKDKDSVFTTSTTLNAKWLEDITIVYNDNKGTGGPVSVTEGADEVYTDPEAVPTRGDYTFLGWNTEQNGSGTYVEADGTMTYADVAALFDGAPTTVTVYAQWGIVSPESTDPDPNGVKVTFDSNAIGATTTVVGAKPQYKYPKYGDSITPEDMPNAPTREQYVFKGWNTQRNGEGTAVDGNTVFNTETLGDALGLISGETDKYEITLYAQWELSAEVADEKKVTLTFNKNTDGSGNVADNVKVVELFKGDALGYDVTEPTNGNFEFDGWFEGSVADGKVTFTANEFSSTTPINADTTYYAKWQMYLLAQIVIPTDGFVYTGSEIKPTYKIFQITYPDGMDQDYEIVDEDNPVYEGDLSEADVQFTATYTKDNTAATLEDVGTYKITVKLTDDSALKAAGAKIAVTNPLTVDISEAGLEVKVDPESQIQKAGDVSAIDLTVTDIANDGSVYKVVYYKWTDADGDGIITDSELPASDKTETVPTEVGKYVVKVELQTSNYVIEEVVSSGVGDVLKYGVTADYPTYPDSKEGQNIVFEIIPNDPSISSVTIESVDNVDEEGNPIDPAVKATLALTDSDYKTAVTFDNTEEPERTEYYSRIENVDADEVEFTISLTNPDTTSMTSATTGVTITDNGDGTYTVKAPLTSKGATPNVIEITTKAGDEADSPTITYTFNIQQLVEAKITLNYGNSPYGEIMKASNISDEDKEAAKEAFNEKNKYGASYIPDTADSKKNVIYPTRAWVNIVSLDNITSDEATKLADPEINMDRNEYAIFVYNGRYFVDPGFNATDSLGNTVEKVTRKITVSRMQKTQLDGLNDVNQLNDEITIADQPSNYLITEVTKPYNYSDSSTYRIRPDIYTMEYSFEDPIQGTVTIERKVVVLQDRGDSYCSDLINDSSVNPIYSYLKTVSLFDGLTGTSRNIYFYRVLDTDASNLINDSDANPVYSYLKTYLPNASTATNPLITHYVELPNSN